LKDITRGRTDRCGWCYLFTVFNLGFFFHVAEYSFLSFTLSLSAEKGHFPVTLKLDLQTWIRYRQAEPPCQTSKQTSKMMSF